MRIYVSSTSEDLREYRAAVVEQLGRRGHQVVSMAGYTADARGPVEKCLADVASAGAYVGLFAFHYGTVPEGHKQAVTEMEFRKATDCALPRLIFMVPDDAMHWPLRFVDRGAAGERIYALRNELLAQNGFTVAFFGDLTELLTVLPQAIDSLTSSPTTSTSRSAPSSRSYRNWIKPLSFEAERTKHLAHFTGRHWVEEKLDDWILKQQNSKVFCLLGGPGIGKSAIACHWCATRKDIVAFHHCVHGHSEKTDPKRILLSLAAQMSARFAEFDNRLSSMDGNELKEIVNADARTVFDNLLLKTFAGNFPVPSNHQLVVIDGLDEASRGQGNELAAFIGEVWGGLPDWLRLVVTARPEMEVTDFLRNLHPFYLNAGSRENLRDIRTFLHRELENRKASDDVINQIVEKSEGMFLYAYLVLDEIRAGRLSLEHIADFPEGLTGYYKGWFGRKFPDLETYHRELHELVSVIVAQKAPLPLTVLYNALGISAWAVEQGLNKLGVLFPLREERQGSQKVRFVTLMHKSLHDWLTDVNPATLRLWAGSFAADPELGNRRLAEEGWRVYSSGRLPEDLYFRQNLLSHLSEAHEHEKLSKVLLDPTLVNTLWTNEFRYEWQRQISSLNHTLSLATLVGDWLEAHSSPPGGTSHEAAVAAKLGKLLQEMGDFDDAILLAEASLRIWQSNGITDSPDMVASLLTLGSIQSVRDELDRATASYERALTIAERAYPADNPKMADVLYELCVFYTKCKRDYKKAWECLEKSVAIRNRSKPVDYAALANCVNDKAVILDAEGKAADYLAIYREALALFEKARPNGHPEMVATLGNIANELRKEGKDVEAVKNLRRAVAMAQNLLLPQHEYSGFVRRNLCGTLLHLTQYDEALEVMRAHVTEMERFPGPDHDATSQARVNLCQALFTAVRLGDSPDRGVYIDEIHRQCQHVRRANPLTVLLLLDLAEDARQVGETHLQELFGGTANRSSRAYCEMVHTDPSETAAARCFFRIMEMLTSNRPIGDVAPEIYAAWNEAEPLMKPQADCLPKTRKVVVSLVSWTARTRLGQDDDAQGIHDAFELVTKLGAEGLETLDHLAGLAVALKRRHQYALSETLCERVLERSRRQLGPEHGQTLTYLSNLAWLREYRGHLEEAELLFSEAFGISCRVLGPEHENTISRASYLAACLLRRGKVEAAGSLLRSFAETLPSSDSPTSARHNLAKCVNCRAIELKDEFAEYAVARLCYELSLEIDPADATTCCNLALLLWSCLGDYPSAGARFERALELKPSSGHIHSTFALFLTHTQRDHQRAREHFEKSMELAPTEAHIPGNYATWCLLSGDLSRSWQLAARSMKLSLPAPDRVTVRPLFCAAAILLLRNCDASIPLGQLKMLFARGINHVAWIITALLEEFDRRLPPEKAKLLRTIIAAVADKAQLERLETDPIWRALPCVPLEAAWPEAPQKLVV